MSDKKIVILGAGITGLSLAERLSRTFKDRVVVVEKETVTGGLASTLFKEGLSFDLGSHRLHEDSTGQVIRYIESILGESLLKRRRNGRLYLQGRYFNYPPNIFNLIKKYPFKEVIRFVSSRLKGLLIFYDKEGDNFETAMIRSVGKDAYEKVYKGYAKKIWGRDPKDISVEGMHRRKAVLDFRSLKSVLKRRHYFYYPRLGIGDIARNLEEKILENQGKVIKGAEIKRIDFNGNIESLTLNDMANKPCEIQISTLISTIPIDNFYNLIFNTPDSRINLEWRGVRLLYVLIGEELKGEPETYYFPSSDIILGRVSNIRKYSPSLCGSTKGTLLTIEIPSSPGDEIWEMDSIKLLDICLRDLQKVNILARHPDVIKHFSLILDKVYPVYKTGWKELFFAMYNRLDKIQNLFTIGRKGLFLHCNIDHCIVQGLGLADFILDGKGADKYSWNKKVADFLKFSARD